MLYAAAFSAGLVKEPVPSSKLFDAVPYLPKPRPDGAVGAGPPIAVLGDFERRKYAKVAENRRKAAEVNLPAGAFGAD